MSVSVLGESDHRSCASRSVIGMAGRVIGMVPERLRKSWSRRWTSPAGTCLRTGGGRARPVASHSGEHECHRVRLLYNLGLSGTLGTVTTTQNGSNVEVTITM